MKAYIIGAGAHAIEVAELLVLLGKPTPIFIDKAEELALLEMPVETPFSLYLGVGLAEARLEILDRWGNHAGSFVTVQHQNSYVSQSASLGNGSLVQFGVVVSSYAVIERGVLLNWNATIGHHVIVGAGSVINPGAAVSGKCILGRGVFVGTGARILEGISIGDHAVIGAGAVVTKDVPAHGRFVGVPARAMR